MPFTSHPMVPLIRIASLASLSAEVFGFYMTSLVPVRTKWSGPQTTLYMRKTPSHAQPKECNTAQHISLDLRRRTILGSLVVITSHGPPAVAAESDETPFNQLLRDIRVGVVRGAQVMDKIDGRWERFSDDFGLGRKRNAPSPVEGPKIRAEVQNDLNVKLAYSILGECDLAFLSSVKERIPRQNPDLSVRIEEVKQLVRRSFFPNGDTDATPQEDFNYEVFTHFKAYNDILVREKVNFAAFYYQFENLVGKRLLELAMHSNPPLVTTNSSNRTNDDIIRDVFWTVDAISTFFLEGGFITSWERSVPPEEDTEDFFILDRLPTAGRSDLQYTVALNGDVTLNSQLLLQELRYRLYPSFVRWSIKQGLISSFANIRAVDDTKVIVAISVDDYFMDTSYSSNPDLFDVKQVLLNIEMELS